ncbi:DsrE family protein [Candidatus Bipolaricaulota bacterium]|nr:DsrE family protein [Candidatus Bipolaricaulota bacterium]
MIFMYLLSAKREDWWEEVTLIVWGPSAKLLAEDEELQDRLAKLGKEGVVLEACKSCAEIYGVADDLEELGVDVYYIGEQLTDYIKEGRRLISL